jgi:hypothetical protein
MKSNEINAKKTNVVSLADEDAVKQVLMVSVSIPRRTLKKLGIFRKTG